MRERAPVGSARSGEALGDAEFAALMAALGPFERDPHLAVAVSGGRDSMALALLADHWARARGGRITALTIDHRLRPGSDAEAAQVGRWLAVRAIRHQTLVWQGPYPIQDLQAAARAARYRLLDDWCRQAHVLHLVTAHHEDDQAETLLLRLARGSGLAGLAGMAPIVEGRHHRLLRPLLSVPVDRLTATLEAKSQAWIEDPSNQNPRFARARVRHAKGFFAEAGLTPARLAETTRHLARARVAVESAVEQLLLEAVALSPLGFATVDPRALAAAPDEVALKALAALVTTIGGAEYPPRFDRLARAAGAIRTEQWGAGRTLGGCHLQRWRDRILVRREAAAFGPPVRVPADGGPILWDGRFIATAPCAAGITGLSVGALGVDGALFMRAIVEPGSTPYLPSCVRPSLPAYWQEASLVAVPQLDWAVAPFETVPSVRFRPVRSLTGPGFALGSGAGIETGAAAHVGRGSGGIMGPSRVSASAGGTKGLDRE